MRRAAILTLLACAAAQAAWVETRSGPFIVYSEDGNDAAREALYRLEQFRFIMGEFTGRGDLSTVWPVTIVVSKPGKELTPPALGFTRMGWLSTWPAGGAPPPAWFFKLAQLFLDDNFNGRMAPSMENAVASLFSTMKWDGGKVVLGAPPVEPERTRDWAVLQYLMTNPETAVRSRALLNNLASGAEEGSAFRNAFEKPRSSVDAEVTRYVAEGKWQTVTVPGRPVDPARQYTIVPMLPSRVRVLPGDILLSIPAPVAEIEAAYRAALNEKPSTASHEGMGLAYLMAKDGEAARQELNAAAADEDVGARGVYELALLETDVQKKRLLLEKASKVNSKWAAPFVQMALTEPGPVRRAYWLKKAAELAPRQPDIWKQLAEAQFDAKQFAEAERSWRAAERVATSPEQRQQLAKAREEFEQARYDAEAAERARQKKEDADEVEKLRREALDRVRQAEQKANASAGGVAAGKKVEDWWDGPPTTKFSGTLERVECRGAGARLTLRDTAGKPFTLLVADAGKVVVLGSGQTQVQMSCGPQKPPRRVNIDYVAKPDVPGEAVQIEFQ